MDPYCWSIGRVMDTLPHDEEVEQVNPYSCSIGLVNEKANKQAKTIFISTYDRQLPKLMIATKGTGIKLCWHSMLCRMNYVVQRRVSAYTKLNASSFIFSCF